MILLDLASLPPREGGGQVSELQWTMSNPIFRSLQRYIVAIFGYGREVKVGVKWANICIFQWTNETCLFGFCFGIG